MNFFGVKGNLHSPRPGWAKGRRQTLNRCLVQPARGVDARLPNESLHPLAERQATRRREQTDFIQSPSGVRPLDFRDHIDVRVFITPTPFRLDSKLDAASLCAKPVLAWASPWERVVGDLLTQNGLSLLRSLCTDQRRLFSDHRRESP